MAENMPRNIYAAKPSTEIPVLIQSIFLAELMRPSKCLWIVAPWISDIPIIDNSLNFFVTLEPSWSRKKIRLTDILVRLLQLECEIRIGINPNDHSRIFARELQTKSAHLSNKPHIQEKMSVHSKGILGDKYYLLGSANFTHNGITMLEETVQFITDPTSVAEARINFNQYWSGQN